MLPQLYSPTQVFVSSFLGGPFAAIHTLRHNYKALGNTKEGQRVLHLGLFLITLLCLLTIFIQRENPSLILTLIIPTPFLYSWFALKVAKNNQVSDMTKQGEDFTSISTKRVISIIFISLITFLTYSTAINVIIFKIENPTHSFIRDYNISNDIYDRNGYMSFEIEFKDGNTFSKENLSTLQKITSNAWYLPYSQRVDSMSNHNVASYENEDMLVKPLIPEEGILTDIQAAKIKQKVLNNLEILNKSYFPETNIVSITVHFGLPNSLNEEKFYSLYNNLKSFEEDTKAKYPVNITTSGSYYSDSLVAYQTYNLPILIHSRLDLYNTDTLNDINNLSNRLRQNKNVQHAWALSDLVNKLNTVMNDNQESSSKENERTQEYLLLYAMELPYANDTQNLVGYSEEKVFINLRLKEDNKDHLEDVINDAKIWFENNSNSNLYIGDDIAQ
jgi:uncharacterized protein YcbK (DUF882 family)